VTFWQKHIKTVASKFAYFYVKILLKDVKTGLKQAQCICMAENKVGKQRNLADFSSNVHNSCFDGEINLLFQIKNLYIYSLRLNKPWRSKPIFCDFLKPGG
jgi:hypothetical protein